MTPQQILWNLPIVITLLSCLLLVFAYFKRNDKLMISAVTLILVNANKLPVVTIAADLGLGMGSAWILMGAVYVTLLLYYEIHPLKTVFPISRGPGILMIVTLGYILVISPIISVNTIVSIRKSLSYLLIYMLGWGTFAAIFRKNPDQTRNRIFLILYVWGTYNLIVITATLILVGPAAYRGEIGGLENTIKIGSHLMSRLQVPDYLNATGLALMAAFSALFIFHLWKKYEKSMTKHTLFAITLSISMVVLFWSAGRTAIIALAITVQLLILIDYYTSNDKKLLRTLLLLSAIGIMVFLFRKFWTGIFFRPGEESVQQALWNSRLGYVAEGLTTYKSNLVFGAGTGILPTGYSIGDLRVESFLPRLLIELGVIGGSFFLITWLVLSYYIIKIDMLYMRLGFAAEWLPSSLIILTWVSSIASFGFSVFNGELALQMAIAAAACVEWRRAHPRHKKEPLHA